MALAVALVACQAAVTTKKTPVALGGKALAPMSFPDFVAGTASSKRVTITSSHFKGTDLKYTADSANPSVATATASGNVVTVTPKGAGTTDVLVTATATADDEEGTASLSFTVTVTAPETAPANNPPEIRTVLGNMSLQVEGMTMLTLSHYYVDREGDTLAYTAISDTLTIATVSVPDAASMIKITAVAEGTAMITVTASDGVEGNAAVPQMFTVTVTAKSVPLPPNQRPTSDPIPDQTVTVVDAPTVELDLSMYFDDADRDELTYTADSSDDITATVTDPDAASMITVTAVAAGTATITVIATDRKSEPVSRAFGVTVLPENNKPPTVVTGTSRDVVVMVGGEAKTIDLARYFTDPEGDELTYDAESSMTMYATEMVEGSTLTVAPVAAGKATITVTAKDNMSNNDGVANPAASLTLNVTVSATPNVAPVVKGDGIPDQSLEMDLMATKPLDLSMYFSDSDSGPIALSYDAESNMTMYATTMVDGSMLTITAVAAGKATITVTAFDGADKVMDTFTVTVNKPSVPSWLDQLPDQVFPHDDMTPRTISLSEYISRATVYDVKSSNLNVVTAEEAEGMLKLTPVGPGIAIVTVTPTNSGGTGSSQTITVTVEPAPVPMSIKPLQAQTIVSDASPMTIMLSEYFSGAKMYAVSSNNEATLIASEEGGTLTLTPHMHGVATVTVTPSNSGGVGTAQTFNVTVQARPMQKTDMMLKALRLGVSTMGTPLNLSEYFEDPDGSITKYSTTTDDAKKVAVYVTLDGSVTPPIIKPTDLNKAVMAGGAMVTLEARAAGTATITVTVTDDSKLTKMVEFTVTVVTTNTPPQSNNDLSPGAPPLPDYSGNMRLKLSDGLKKPINAEEIRLHFADDDLTSPEGDLLTFTAKYVATGGQVTDAAIADGDVVATATIVPDTWNGDAGGVDKFTVTVTPKKVGVAHDILIVATDLAGAKVPRTISVQVNRLPVAEGVTPDNSPDDYKPRKLSEYKSAEGLNSGATDIMIDLDDGNNGYFHDDDDGDTLVCSAVPSVTGDTAPAVVKMAATTNILTLDVVAMYTTGLVPMTVTVRCRDGWGTGTGAVEGEWSPTQTFTVSVTQPGPDGSSH